MPIDIQKIKRAAPTDEQIMDAIRGLGEISQKVLTRTVWKDGIDIEEPSFDARNFARWLTTELIATIERQESDLRRQGKALERWEAIFRDALPPAPSAEKGPTSGS